MMSKFPLLFVLCASAQAQTSPGSFEKAAPDVDGALRARVAEFYQDHVDSKFRKAEQLVAEESKDGFYAANKPAIQAFRVSDIAYSENYSRAKVTIVGKMMITFMGMGAAKLMDVPFPSYWKLEEGKWCWYIYNDPNRMTPFGKINPQTTGGAAADPNVAFKMTDLATVTSGVQADRTAVKLAKTAGAEERITLSNHMPGAVTLQLPEAPTPEVEMKLDRTELLAGQKAVLTIRTLAAKDYLSRMVRVLVQPTNQAIDIRIGF